MLARMQDPIGVCDTRWYVSEDGELKGGVTPGGMPVKILAPKGCDIRRYIREDANFREVN